MSLFGLSNSSFIQGLDTKKTNFKKLSSRFISSGKNFLNSDYQTKIDTGVFNVFQDYMYENNIYNTNSEMGTKLTHMNYTAPKVHYEMKKPAVNIIGGYVGAKSQQNRESYSVCIIRDIATQLLPGLFSDGEQACHRIAADILGIQTKTEEYLDNSADWPTTVGEDVPVSENHFCYTFATLDSPVMNLSKSQNTDDLQTVPSVQTVNTLPTYASVVSTPPPVVPTMQQSTTEQEKSLGKPNKGSSLSKSKNAKNRRKRKRKQWRKQRQEEQQCHPLPSTSEKPSFFLNDHDFPSLCEEATDAVIEPENSYVQTCKINEEVNPSLHPNSLLCSLDEVDSPSSQTFSDCLPVNSSLSMGCSVVCHNSTIEFIINGNDELSDNDSDWSCDTIDSFEDDVWESFKQNFECFQNLFAVDRVCPSSDMLPEKDGNCLLEDNELLLFINHMDMDVSGDSSASNVAEVMAARLKDANDRWNHAMKDVIFTENQNSKVNFLPDNQLVKVHYLEDSLEEMRWESWDHYHLDRCRFMNRIQTLEPILAWCFEETHRQKVWDRLLKGV